MKIHPFRFKKRKMTRGHYYYALFDFEPSKPRATGILVKKNQDFPEIPYGKERAIAEAYRIMDTFRPISAPTLGYYAEDFFFPDKCTWSKRLLKRQKKEKTYFKELRSRLDNYILPHWRHVPLDKITTRTIEEWLINLKGISTKKPLAGSSLNKVLTPFRYILDQAVYEEIIKFNPAKEIDMFPDKSDKSRALTREEIDKLFPLDYEECINLWGSLEWYTFFYMIYSCGLRPGEVSAFEWTDWIKESHGAVISKSYDSRNRIVKGLKTDKKGLATKLSLFSTRLELLLTELEKKKDSNQVFTAPETKGYIRPETSNKHFKTVCKKLGIYDGDIRQYYLRHTFITNTLGNLPETLVNKFAGHTKKNDTYDHRSDERLLREVLEYRELLEKSL